MPAKAFYMPASFLVMWERFKEITRVEGGCSVILRKFIESYVDEHEPSNAQRRMTIWTGEVQQADPFECGHVVAISQDGFKVNCRLGGVKKKFYCLNHCMYNKVKK